MQPAALAPYGLNALTGWGGRHRRLRLPRAHVRGAGAQVPEADGPFDYMRTTLGEAVAFAALWSYWISTVGDVPGSRSAWSAISSLFSRPRAPPARGACGRLHLAVRRHQPARRQERRPRPGHHFAAEDRAAPARHGAGLRRDPREPRDLHPEPADAAGRAATIHGGRRYRALRDARLRVRRGRRRSRRDPERTIPRAT